MGDPTRSVRTQKPSRRPRTRPARRPPDLARSRSRDAELGGRSIRSDERRHQVSEKLTKLTKLTKRMPKSMPIKCTHLIEGVISEREAHKEHVLRDEEGLYDAGERLSLIAVRVTIRVPDEGGNQGGHQGGPQRSSEAIRGHQRPSEAIRGHQRPSEAISLREDDILRMVHVAMQLEQPARRPERSSNRRARLIWQGAHLMRKAISMQ